MNLHAIALSLIFLLYRPGINLQVDNVVLIA